MVNDCETWRIWSMMVDVIYVYYDNSKHKHNSNNNKYDHVDSHEDYPNTP